MCLVIQDSNQSPTSGPRRGQRHRYAPLDWWRCEKVVYGKPDTGLTVLPHIREIQRLPKPEIIPLGKQGKRKRSRAPSKARSVDLDIEPEPEPFNPEEGWDDDTDQLGVVLDYDTTGEVEKRKS